MANTGPLYALQRFWALVRRTPHQPDTTVSHYGDVDEAVRDATSLNRSVQNEGDSTYVVRPVDSQQSEAERNWKRRGGH